MASQNFSICHRHDCRHEELIGRVVQVDPPIFLAPSDMSKLGDRLNLVDLIEDSARITAADQDDPTVKEYGEMGGGWQLYSNTPHPLCT